MTQANRSRMRVAIVIVVVIASAVVVMTLYRTSRTPARRQVLLPVEPNDGWEKAYARAASNLGTMEEMTRARHAFIDRYPRSPATADVLNQLGCMHIQAKQFAEAVRAFEAAKKLVAAGVGAGEKGSRTPSLGILDVNIAEAHRQARKFAQADAVLTELIARPLPAKLDAETYVPQVFVGPLTLADVRQDQHRAANADAIRAAVAERAIELAKANPEPAQAEWITSYAAAAYTKRINALLERKPPQFAAARALAEEFKRRLPGYNGMVGYDDMVANVAYVESNANRTTSTPTTARSVRGR
jgi:hypothetical protein